MSREQMRKLMETVAGDPLAKYGITPDEYTTIENGWVEIEIDHEVDWGSVQDVDMVLSEADPEQRMYRDYTAMGDDVPNAMAFNLEHLDEIDAILQSKLGKRLERILNEWAGPGTYSDEGEAAFYGEEGWDEDEDEDEY